MSGSYLEDLGLNSLSPALAAGSSDDSDEFDLDLSLFTNSTFFDVDFSMDSTSAGRTGGAKTTRVEPEERQIGAEGFKAPQNISLLPSFAVGDALQFNLSSITRTPNNLPVTTLSPLPPPCSQANSPVSHSSPSSSIPKAKKQKVSSPQSSFGFAADEDKRRRNTAASARFRVKKKQREQQLHETAKEMMDKAQQLEERVKQLEMENRWLKNLVVEKKELEEGEGSVVDV
jgi:hypothetical protein